MTGTISYEDEFVVFVRENRPTPAGSETVERELVHCATYAEAEWVRRENEHPGRRCIIRYVGPAGGGD
jgi:hypothetical protein